MADGRAERSEMADFYRLGDKRVQMRGAVPGLRAGCPRGCWALLLSSCLALEAAECFWDLQKVLFKVVQVISAVCLFNQRYCLDLGASLHLNFHQNKETQVPWYPGSIVRNWHLKSVVVFVRL